MGLVSENGSCEVTRTTQRVTTSPSPYVQLCPQAGVHGDFGDKLSELYVISRVLTTTLLEKALDGDELGASPTS